MNMRKIAPLFVLLLLTAPLLVIPTAPAQTSSVYFSVEPVAISPLTDTNASINGLETPPTPSPVSQNFTVEIHLIGVTTNNVSGVEVHFFFDNMLAFAVPTGFTDFLGTTGGVLTGPQSKLLYGISAGFYDAAGNSISGPPYTGAVRYEVAAASTATAAWNNADGIVAKITFQIIKQPLGSNGETTVNLPLACDFTDLTDKDAVEVDHGTVQGTLTMDATSAAPITQYSLTVNAVGNGTVTKNPSNTTYASGTNVSLTAVPGASWVFQGWSGDVTGVQSPVNLTMNGNKTVTATFTQPGQYYSLTVKVVGNGTVTQNPLNSTYLSGSIVTLSAAPSPNWTFSGWSGDLTGTQNPTSITVNGNKTVTATFVQASSISYSLNVNIVGNGIVTQNPLDTTYASGTIVTLTAVPNASWTFQGWSGDLTGTQNPTSITVNGNKTVTATFVMQTSGGSIDLFTQKTSFSGRGPNQSSDAFQQQELVVLYALVTFSGDPIANKIVAFQVNGPPNSLQNMTVTGEGVTNSSGIAEFSFRITTAPIDGQQTVFGKWYAVATVDVDQVPLSDSLTFEVGWIISIKSIATLNNKLVPQTSFARQDTVVFNLTLINMALTPRNATITVDAKDVTGNLIIHAELDNLNVPPGESYTQLSSQIPATARLGEANVSATAYTAPPSSGGTPYSPSVFTTFNIVLAVYYTLTVNVVGNGSVTENPAETNYLSGTIVTLTAVPGANWTFQGWSGDVAGAQNPVNVTMDRNKTATATFTHVSVGHDVAITAVSASPSQVLVGEMVQIMVSAANLGSYSENFNVTVYYNSVVIEVIPIVSMAPGSSATLTVEWNTTNVNPAVYTMSANATIVEGDINPANNNIIDGQVTITTSPVIAQLIPYPVILILFLMGLGIPGGLATLMLFVAYSMKRRKRKTGKTPRYVVVSHPHI